MRIDKDYTGTKVGVLTIVGPSHREYGYAIWNAKCECGKIRQIAGNKIYRALTGYKRCICDRIAKKKSRAWGGDRKNCRICNKRLPKSRYFHHDTCLQTEASYGELEYGRYCQYGSGY